MEDELRKLPLRSAPDDYADRVMTHIARAESRKAERLIAAQVTVAGIIALAVTATLGSDIVPVMDDALELFNSTWLALGQIFGDALNLLNDLHIEPLESIATQEWAIVGGIAAIVWLLANGLLVADRRKEKTT